MQVISITIPWFHPAYKAGGPIQSIANLVEQFAENISYKIFCSNTDLDGTVLNVPINNWVRYNQHTKLWYVAKNNNTILLFKKAIKDSKADVLFINGIYSWHFNLLPFLFCKTSRKIVSVRGMLHPGALSQKPFKKKMYLHAWKLLGLHKKCYFHASNEDEKIYIQKVFGKIAKVYVAQNFPKILWPQPVPEKNAGYLRMVSVALISPMKNILLVLQGLMNCDSYITYNIYGPIKDEAYWNECQEQISRLPENIIVKYHGDIPPQEVENVLAQNHVFILPSKSENFGHAIFEALSAGKPVITSYNTPWKNLKEVKAGMNVDPENTGELTNAIQYFTYMDEKQLTQWSISANQYSANAIDIDAIKAQYQEMFFGN